MCMLFTFNDNLIKKKKIPKEIVWLVLEKNEISLKSVFCVCVERELERDIGAHHNSVSLLSIDIF